MYICMYSVYNFVHNHSLIFRKYFFNVQLLLFILFIFFFYDFSICFYSRALNCDNTRNVWLARNNWIVYWAYSCAFAIKTDVNCIWVWPIITATLLQLTDFLPSIAVAGLSHIFLDIYYFCYYCVLPPVNILIVFWYPLYLLLCFLCFSTFTHI